MIDFTDPTVDEQEKKSWLINSAAPITQVVQFMTDTYRLRTSQFKATKNLAELLNQWPRLLDTPGMVSNPSNPLPVEINFTLYI